MPVKVRMATGLVLTCWSAAYGVALFCLVNVATPPPDDPLTGSLNGVPSGAVWAIVIANSLPTSPDASA
jgi:hypothetical protein